MQIILSVSIAVLAGLLMTRVVKSLKLPDVTAYLMAGIFVGPYFLGSLGIDGLGFISMEAVDLMTLVSQVALGFIAFAIGNEFRLEDITHIGRQAVIVGVFQGLAAMLCVDRGKSALAGNHHIIFAAGAVNDHDITAAVKTANDAHMGVIGIE